MAETILAIDLVPGGVRLAELSRSLSQTTIAGLHHTRYTEEPEAAPFSAAAQAAAALMEDNGLEPGLVILGLPTRLAFLRRLHFPFGSQAKVKAVLPLELEGELPRASDEVVADAVTSRRLADSSQQVLAAAVDQDVLEQAQAAFAELGIPLDGISLRVDGLSQLAGQWGEEHEERLLWLDLHSGGGCLAYRLGDHPLVLRALPPCGDPEALFREIKLSLHSAGLAPGEAPQGVVVTGELPQEEGFITKLGSALELPVRTLDRLQSPLPVLAAAGGRVPDAFGVAVGLGLRAAIPGAGGFNFVPKGALARRGGVDVQRLLPKVAATAAVLALGFGLVSAVDVVLKQRRLAAVERKIEQVVEGALPELRGRFLPEQYASILRTRVRDLQEGQGPDVGGGQKLTGVLSSLTQGLPPKVPLRLSALTLDPGTVRLTGRSSSYATVEQITRSLSEVPEFAQVRLRGATATADGQQVEFQLEIVRPKEGG